MFESKMGIGKVRLMHRGTFDLNKIHQTISGWINEHLYDYSEKENTEKAMRKNLESVIKFLGDRKVTDFVFFEVEGSIETFNMVRKGKVQEGEVIVKLNATVSFDYKKQWQNSKFQEFMLHVFLNYIFRPKVRAYVEKLDIEFNELQDVTKEAMELYN
jgi:hypothetical protein